MSRRDYEQLAAAFRQAYVNTVGTSNAASEQRHYGVTEALSRVADVLQAENPRFDRDRFREAAQDGVRI